METEDIIEAIEMLRTEIEHITDDDNHGFYSSLFHKYDNFIKLNANEEEKSGASMETACRRLFTMGYRRALLDRELEELIDG